VFKNRVLRKIFGDLRGRKQEAEEDCIIRHSIACTLHQVFRMITSRRMR
jgi:hypothetical protein